MSEDAKVTLGGRDFAVPQFSIWAQRKVTPMLLGMVGKLDKLEDPENFGKLVDVVYDVLTIQTVDGKKSGQKVNDISKDDFEDLSIRAMDLAKDVIPVLLVQAGLANKKEGGGAGAAVPETPLAGETTSTTSSPDTSSP
jgi:hypothetical protein